MSWVPEDAALELLEQAGPFETAAYRAACVEALTGVRDVSFAARSGEALAAAALVRVGRTAYLPYGYGGVRSSRPLDEQETRVFLRAARAASGAARLILRDVAFAAASGGRPIASTSVAWLDAPPTERYAKKARQSMRRAARAGASCAVSADAAAFLSLYASASQEWGVSYPLDLIAAAADRGLARFYDVTIEDRIVGSFVALRGTTHWMYWLSALDETGRKAEVGYMGVAAMLADAYDERIAAVNLGGSAGLPGVAHFKQRLGGVGHAVVEWRAAPPVVAAVDRILSLRRSVS
jgi:CelD/BcsL family acetyltransferase involved in cellulose biosynthesis